ENVAQLTQAWSYRVAPPAPASVDPQPSPEAESLRSRPRTSEAGQARGSREPLRGAGAPSNSGGGGVPAASGNGGAPRELSEGRGCRGATDAFGNPPGNPEATPIVVNGVMYLPAGGTKVVALNAETGKELWQHELPKDTFTTARGLGFWPGDRTNPARILL